jgi:hypothetical protein
MCQQNEKYKWQANGLGWQQQHNFWQPCWQCSLASLCLEAVSEDLHNHKQFQLGGH